MAAFRARVYGRVQGVGFRESTARFARTVGAKGWVRNVDDGSVEAWIEGPESVCNAVFEFLKKGPSTARVDRVDWEPIGVGQGLTEFSVRRSS